MECEKYCLVCKEERPASDTFCGACAGRLVALGGATGPEQALCLIKILLAICAGDIAHCPKMHHVSGANGKGSSAPAHHDPEKCGWCLRKKSLTIVKVGIVLQHLESATIATPDLGLGSKGRELH